MSSKPIDFDPIITMIVTELQHTSKIDAVSQQSKAALISALAQVDQALTLRKIHEYLLEDEE